MKDIFFKRLCAFIIDSFILTIIFSLITVGFFVDTKDIEEDLMYTLEKYNSNQITIEEYTDEVMFLNYELQKRTITTNILDVVLYIGYFVLFSYLNKGQTIGKKICKIGIVNIDGNRASILNILVRSLFIYGMSTLLFSVIFVNILHYKIFTYSYIFINYMEIIFVIVTFVMILKRKDNKGLHDMMAKTNVIEKVR